MPFSKRFTLDEVKDLAAQFPSEIAYYLRQRSGFLEKFGLDEFFRRIGRREQATPTQPFHARIVLSVLQNVVTRGEIQNILAQLPAE